MEGLFNDDNNESESFFRRDPQGFLRNAPKSNKKGRKAAMAQIQRKRKIDERKQDLRNALLDLFVVFKGDVDAEKDERKGKRKRGEADHFTEDQEPRAGPSRRKRKLDKAPISDAAA